MENPNQPKTLQQSDEKRLVNYSAMSSLTLATGNLPEIKKNGIQISKLKKENPRLLKLEIVKLIEMVLSLVNVIRPLSPEAILLTADMISDDFWYLKVEEIKHAFLNGIKGKYSDYKILDRVDAQVFLAWLRSYTASDELIGISEKKSQAHKSKDEEGKNVSILESEGFRKAMHKYLKGRPMPTPSTEEEKESHREMIRKQASEIMKNEKLKKS